MEMIMDISAPPRREVKSSPPNAIVLLILALGKLCESYGQQRGRFEDENVAHIPGIAYYPEAAKLLSRPGGKLTLPTVQAYILASQYNGLLGDIQGSWHWIY
jgi:hypothetical protein